MKKKAVLRQSPNPRPSDAQHREHLSPVGNLCQVGGHLLEISGAHRVFPPPRLACYSEETSNPMLFQPVTLSLPTQQSLLSAFGRHNRSNGFCASGTHRKLKRAVYLSTQRANQSLVETLIS